MADAQNTGSSEPGWPVLRETITDRNILIYVLSLSAAGTGIWTARVAIGWLAWDLTRSSSWLGIIASAALLPAAILAPIGGAIADKIGPLRALQWTQIGQLILSVVIFILAVTEVLTIELLLAYILAKSVVASLGWSSGGGFIRVLASDRNLLAAVMWKDIATGVARIVGPALSGMVIINAGTEFVFLVSILGYSVFLYGLTKITVGSGWGPNYADGANSIGTSFKHAMECVKNNREIPYLIAFLAIGLVGVDKFPVKELFVQDMGPPKSIVVAFAVGGAITAVYMIWLASRGSLGVLPRVLGPCFLACALAILFLSLPLYNVAVLSVAAILGAGITILSTSVYVLALTFIPPRILFTGMGLYYLILTVVPMLFVFVLSVAVPHDTFYLRWLIAAIAMSLLALWVWLRKRVPAIAEALGDPTSREVR